MQTKRNLWANSTLEKGIVLPCLAFIFIITFLSAFFPVRAAYLLGHIQDWIFGNLNWMYVWSATIFVVFLLFLIFSKYGSIVLGDNDSRPDYSFFSWMSMLFAAGMGIGLMYSIFCG